MARPRLSYTEKILRERANELKLAQARWATAERRQQKTQERLTANAAREFFAPFYKSWGYEKRSMAAAVKRRKVEAKKALYKQATLYEQHQVQRKRGRPRKMTPQENLVNAAKDAGVFIKMGPTTNIKGENFNKISIAGKTGWVHEIGQRKISEVLRTEPSGEFRNAVIQRYMRENKQSRILGGTRTYKMHGKVYKSVKLSQKEQIINNINLAMRNTNVEADVRAAVIKELNKMSMSQIDAFYHTREGGRYFDMAFNYREDYASVYDPYDVTSTPNPRRLKELVTKRRENADHMLIKLQNINRKRGV